MSELRTGSRARPSSGVTQTAGDNDRLLSCKPASRVVSFAFGVSLCACFLPTTAFVFIVYVCKGRFSQDL